MRIRIRNTVNLHIKKKQKNVARLRSFVELERIEDLEEGLLGDLNVVEVDLPQLLVLAANLLQNLVRVGQVGLLRREILQRCRLHK
jgi:hypothetical protein